MMPEPIPMGCPPAAFAAGAFMSRKAAPRHGGMTPRSVLAMAFLALISPLLGGCPEDPMGPDNRMALIALGHCDHAQALQLADSAIERGDAVHAQRAWMLKAAILRDQGRTDAAEALYPELEAAWRAARKTELNASRRERDIAILLDIARAERRANGLAVDCSP